MSYDAALEQALEVSQAKERELADQVARLRAKDLRRRDTIKGLRENIGELNSMLAHKEQVLESVRRAHEKQAQTIRDTVGDLTTLQRGIKAHGLANASLEGTNNDLVKENRQLRHLTETRDHQNQVLTDQLNEALREKASLRRKLEEKESLIQGAKEERLGWLANINKYKDQVEELQGKLEEAEEDECNCAPNLALAACKKKMEQLEGMLESQRRSTRELGVNLQRVRDEREAFKNQAKGLQAEIKDLQWRLEAAKENWQSRHSQALTERDDYLRQLQDLQGKRNRALSLARRAVSILEPVKVTETWDGDTRITWSPPSSVRGGVTVTPQAKKAEPRPANAWRCAAMKDGHSCDVSYHHALSDGHHCHCGQWWGGK